MATNLDLDDGLIEEARRLGNHKTKREAVMQALLEYTQRLRQADIVEAFGTVAFDARFNYKTQRRRP